MTHLGVFGLLWSAEKFQPGWLTWSNGKIDCVEFGEPPPKRRSQLLDCRGLRVTPGLIDTLLHGFGGVDVSHATADELQQLALQLARLGVTSAVGGLYPLTSEETRQNASYWNAFANQKNPAACDLMGWHMEGPFIAPHMRGALPQAGIEKPDAQAAERLLQACGGWLKITTVAPELSGLPEAALVLTQSGVTLSIGHTAATYQECVRFQDSGAFVLAQTHLGNRISPLQAREPGPFGFVLEGRVRWVGIIPDGVHVNANTLRVLQNQQPLGSRMMFQSDNISHAGLRATSFTAGGKLLHRDGPVARDDEGGLAGTLDPLPALLQRRIHEGSLTWEQAVHGSCDVPGSWAQDRGKLRIGQRADIVAWDESFEAQQVWIQGRSLARD